MQYLPGVLATIKEEEQNRVVLHVAFLVEEKNSWNNQPFYASFAPKICIAFVLIFLMARQDRSTVQNSQQNSVSAYVVPSKWPHSLSRARLKQTLNANRARMAPAVMPFMH